MQTKNIFEKLSADDRQWIAREVKGFAEQNKMPEADILKNILSKGIAAHVESSIQTQSTFLLAKHIPDSQKSSSRALQDKIRWLKEDDVDMIDAAKLLPKTTKLSEAQARKKVREIRGED